MRLDLLAGILADAGLGVLTETIFTHQMPADCGQGILLKLPIAGVQVDPNLPGYYKNRGIQTIVRAAAQADGDRLAYQVSQALTLYNKEFRDADDKLLMRIKQMFPLHLPIRYPRSPGEVLEWSVNYSVAYDWPDPASQF